MRMICSVCHLVPKQRSDDTVCSCTYKTYYDWSALYTNTLSSMCNATIVVYCTMKKQSFVNEYETLLHVCILLDILLQWNLLAFLFLLQIKILFFSCQNSVITESTCNVNISECDRYCLFIVEWPAVRAFLVTAVYFHLKFTGFYVSGIVDSKGTSVRNKW